MPNNILRIVIAGEQERTLADIMDMMKYALSLNVMSREFRYYYQLRQIFK